MTAYARWAAAAGVAIASLAAAAAVGRSGFAAGESRRYGEAVGVPGSALAPLAGSSVDELWVWSWQDGRWTLLPSQVDERGNDMAFVALEDDKLDDNDVLVFPMPLNSEPRPQDSLPPGMDPGAAWAEVRADDPIEPESSAYAYVFLSRRGPAATPAPQVTWDAGSLEIRASRYTLGFANPTSDGFAGVKRLSLVGSSDDLVDRLKLRLSLDLPELGQQVVTEQTLLLVLMLAGMDISSLTPDPVIVGPVRVLVDAAGAGAAYGERLALGMTFFGDFAIPGLELNEGRVSIDMTTKAVGATYRDANSSASAVTIDGLPDQVPAAPLPAWREIRLSRGSLVFLRTTDGADRTASVYYRDDRVPEQGDTGDPGSFGDQGVKAGNMVDLLTAGFPGQIVVTPPDGSVAPETLAENLRSPVTVHVTFGHLPEPPSPPKLYLPLALMPR